MRRNARRIVRATPCNTAKDNQARMALSTIAHSCTQPQPMSNLSNKKRVLHLVTKNFSYSSRPIYRKAISKESPAACCRQHRYQTAKPPAQAGPQPSGGLRPGHIEEGYGNFPGAVLPVKTGEKQAKKQAGCSRKRIQGFKCGVRSNNRQRQNQLTAAHA